MTAIAFLRKPVNKAQPASFAYLQKAEFFEIFQSVKKNGQYWNRTSDPKRVMLVL